MSEDIQMNFKQYSLSDVGMVRSANEDCCGDRMTVNGYVFVVCDGMGGHVGGATAAGIAVRSILDFFENPIQNIIIGINDALGFANSQVYDAALNNLELKGMGTTATVLVINSTDCYIGHVGDSRIYLKSNGRLNRLTKDHSFVQGLVDQGVISDEDAEKHPKKNQILQAIGIKDKVEPSVCEAAIQPKPGDCFLLCSDGLNGMISDREINNLIDPTELKISCESLIKAANFAGGKDNVTATLVTVTESPYVISLFKDFNPIIGGTTTIIEPFQQKEQKKKSKFYLVLVITGFALIFSCVLYLLLRESPKQVKNTQEPIDTNSGKDSSGTTEVKPDKSDIPLGKDLGKSKKTPVPNTNIKNDSLKNECKPQI